MKVLISNNYWLLVIRSKILIKRVLIAPYKIHRRGRCRPTQPLTRHFPRSIRDAHQCESVQTDLCRRMQRARRARRAGCITLKYSYTHSATCYCECPFEPGKIVSRFCFSQRFVSEKVTLQFSCTSLELPRAIVAAPSKKLPA